MLLQARQNKRGLSLVIGYILLIAISIVMSIIVYQWLKTYVPTESIKCSEGTSIFISDISYDCTEGNKKLDITVKNNGKFSVGGYFIHASEKEGEELATIDLSSKIIDGGSEYLNSINFLGIENMAGRKTEDKNFLIPNDFIKSSFDVSGEDKIVKIELIPTRIQKVNNKERLVSCSEAKVEELVKCNEE